MPEIPKQTALILGSTGAVGKVLLKELLNSPNYTRVGEFGRRTTALDTHGLANKEKLVQKIIDFEKLNEAGLTNEKWDVVFIALGTTKAQAGSAQNFKKIDQDYVVNAAQAAKHPSVNQKLIYVSSASANSSSFMLYTKSKGETEERLAGLGYSDTIVARPAMLLGAERSDSRPLESVAVGLVGRFSTFAKSLGIPVPSLATAVRIAGELGSANLPTSAAATTAGGTGNTAKYTVIGNNGLRALAEEKTK